jgi:hypothetical protein
MREIAPGVIEFGNPGSARLSAVSCSMRQARLALFAAGKLAAVETAIDALEEPDRTAARIAWEYSTEVQRDHGLVLSLAPALELDAEALDALFIAAAAL